MRNTFLLTGDIGGTNSRLALYDTSDHDCSHDNPLLVKYYRNAEAIPQEAFSKDPDAFANHIIVPFLEYCWSSEATPSIMAKIASSVSKRKKKSYKLPNYHDCYIIACMATAGTVVNNHARMTNLNNLMVDGDSIQDNRHHPILRRIIICSVINDFVAQGYGCLTLQAHEVKQLSGPHVLDMNDLNMGVKVCVGAGTGLGECYMTKNGDGPDDHYICYPSEGGHVEYAPRNDLEIRLWRFLNDKFSSTDRISVERVVSGKGLANVYDFLANAFPERIIKDVHEEFLNAGDQQGRVVAVNAAENTLCDQALSIMMSAYGCEVGSAAIKFIPTGGLFISGGLTPKNIHRIEKDNSEFKHSYRNKGRVSPILDRVPLFAVLVEDLGVRGAHKAAMMDYEDFTRPEIKQVKGTAIGRFIQEYSWSALAATALASFIAGVFLNQKNKINFKF